MVVLPLLREPNRVVDVWLNCCKMTFSGSRRRSPSSALRDDEGGLGRNPPNISGEKWRGLELGGVQEEEGLMVAMDTVVSVVSVSADAIVL